MAITFSLCLVTCQALAQAPGTDQPPISLDLSAFLVVFDHTDEGATEQLSQAISAAPGDVIEWRLEAHNEADSSAAQVALDLPIPDGAVYLEESALASRMSPSSEAVFLDPSDLTFSADGGLSFAAAPLTREVEVTVGSETTTTIEVVPLSEYTHVRLVIESFEPQLTYILTLRAEVN